MGVVEPTAHQAIRPLVARVLDTLQRAAGTVWDDRGVPTGSVPFSLCWTAEAGRVASQLLEDGYSESPRRRDVTLDLEAARYRQSVHGNPQRVRVPEEERAVYLDGRRVATDLDPMLSAFLALVVLESPDPITFPEMRRRRPILKGVNAAELRQRVPEPVSSWLRGSKKGHYLVLPAAG